MSEAAFWTRSCHDTKQTLFPNVTTLNERRPTKCQPAVIVVNMQRSVADLPYLVGLFAQKRRDFDFVIEFIAE
jgi:hypothetical protein